MRAGSEGTDNAMMGQEIRPGSVSTSIAILLLLVGTALIIYLFAPIAEPVSFGIWAGLLVVAVLGMSATLIVGIVRDPDDDVLVRFWWPLLKVMGHFISLLTAASVWILLPMADVKLHEFMMVMYVWFVVVYAMSETKVSRSSGLATLGVLGSVAIYEFTLQTPSSIALGVVMLMIAAGVIAFQLHYRTTLVEMIRAKVLAERAEADLNAALAETKAQRDAVTRFLGSASHDLQQPIQAAQLFFDRAVVEPDVALRQSAIEGAGRAFGAAQSLLKEMLEHLRLESGAADVRLAQVKLDPLLTEIALQYGALAEKSEIVITTKSTSHDVQGDQRLIRRILGNVVSNAITHSGGRRILIGVRRRQHQISIYVIDDGKGVPPNLSDTIFEEFGSQNEGGKTNFGLGLFASRRFARAMGGDLVIDSRWNKGSCFALDLSIGKPVERETSGQHHQMVETL